MSRAGRSRSPSRTRRGIPAAPPRAAWNPGRSVVRLAAGVGLWDTAAGHYAVPGASATATTPGGAAPSGAALFHLAFRSSEPAPAGPPPGVTLIDASIEGNVNSRYWREQSQ